MRQSGQAALVDFLAQLPATSRLVFSFFGGVCELRFKEVLEQL